MTVSNPGNTLSNKTSDKIVREITKLLNYLYSINIY